MHFSFLIFPNYNFQADLDHVDSVLRQLYKSADPATAFTFAEFSQAADLLSPVDAEGEEGE